MLLHTVRIRIYFNGSVIFIVYKMHLFQFLFHLFFAVFILFTRNKSFKVVFKLFHCALLLSVSVCRWVLRISFFCCSFGERMLFIVKKRHSFGWPNTEKLVLNYNYTRSVMVTVVSLEFSGASHEYLAIFLNMWWHNCIPRIKFSSVAIKPKNIRFSIVVFAHNS